jgi:hypothetical protein
MYCPVCGAESTQGLNYCKRCGAGLSASTPPFEQKAPPAKLASLLVPVALVCIGGFIALFTTVYNLGERTGFDTRALVAIMAFGGATVVSVVGLMVWLIMRLSGYQSGTTHRKEERHLLRDFTPQQLPAPPISMPSVTENTTRNFDPTRYRERSE